MSQLTMKLLREPGEVAAPRAEGVRERNWPGYEVGSAVRGFLRSMYGDQPPEPRRRTRNRPTAEAGRQLKKRRKPLPPRELHRIHFERP